MCIIEAWDIIVTSDSTWWDIIVLYNIWSHEIQGYRIDMNNYNSVHTSDRKLGQIQINMCVDVDMTEYYCDVAGWLQAHVQVYNIMCLFIS